MKNRLNLDFSLVYQDERKSFIDSYLPTLGPNPTEDELTTISNYILWGVDRTTGQTENQKKNFYLSSKNSVWRNQNDDHESIEALTESPTFNEALFRPLTVHYTAPTAKKFDRDEALRNSPHFLRTIFEALFRKIDRLDLSIGYYEHMYGKKGKEVAPPRAQLLALFSEEECAAILEEISGWDQHILLKKKRELVALRTEQYVLRDSYSTPILNSNPTPISTFDTTISFEAGIEVLPLGLRDHSKISKALFSKDGVNLRPTFDESKLRAISTFYWEKQNYTPTPSSFYFDFRKQEHVYTLFGLYAELASEIGQIEDSTLGQFLGTLEFYIREADLSEVQREILDLKIKKVHNQDIADRINGKWGKNYAPNYISTIFTQRIVPKICAAAKYHEQVVGNIWFEEEFKVCTCCGRTLLRDTTNFTHKSRAKDGFMARCKKCEKSARGGEGND